MEKYIKTHCNGAMPMQKIGSLTDPLQQVKIFIGRMAFSCKNYSDSALKKDPGELIIVYGAIEEHLNRGAVPKRPRVQKFIEICKAVALQEKQTFKTERCCLTIIYELLTENLFDPRQMEIFFNAATEIVTRLESEKPVVSSPIAA